MNINFADAEWLNRPLTFEIEKNKIKMITRPDTDLWQRTYYGFRNANAPALLIVSENNFSFTVRAIFQYRNRFDQCGVIIFIDPDNWFKASVEFEDKSLSRLGSVVTNQGYSDWATTDIPAASAMWFRLSRRGPDFRIESSADGINFKQMRIFHLHGLGETADPARQHDLPETAVLPVRFGLYACSPLKSSFEAIFDNFKLERSSWMAHSEG